MDMPPRTHLRTPQRVQHELKRRLVQVAGVRDLSPRLRRITFAGEALAGFASPGPDDHVKLFFPAPGEDRPAMPELGPDGPALPPGAARPVSRDYTPRCFDPEAGELDIDFVLHGDGSPGDGPATSWAAQARAGQWLGIGGPRGSMLLPRDFAAYLLIGDETALPAIARHLEEIPPGVRARAIIEVADEREEIDLPTKAAAKITWLHRNGLPAGMPALLAGALSTLPLQAGQDLYAFVAAEIDTARLLRRHLVEGIGLPRAHVRAAGYWRAGEAGAHSRIDD